MDSDYQGGDLRLRRVFVAAAVFTLLAGGGATATGAASNGEAASVAAAGNTQPHAGPDSKPRVIDIPAGKSEVDCQKEAEAAKRKGEDTYLCIAPSKEKVSRKLRGAAAAAAADGPYWCSGQEWEKVYLTRTELCSAREFTMILLKDAKPWGTGKVSVLQEIETSTTSPIFHENFHLTVLSLTGGLADGVSLMVAKPDCAPSCNQDAGPMPSLKTMKLLDFHDGTSTRSWKERASSSDSISLGWTLLGSAKTSTDSATWGYGELGDAYSLRCDSKLGGATPTTGCVFPSYTPTLTVDSTKYPYASSYIYLAQQFSKLGVEGKGEPLHREADNAKAEQNRKKVCDSTFKHSPVTLHFDPKAQCDEFPFAKSKESGGQSVQSGKECQHFWASGRTASPVAYNMSWSGSNKKCARASMTKKDNEGVGGALGRFTTKNRLLDDDGYWVSAKWTGTSSPPVQIP